MRLRALAFGVVALLGTLFVLAPIGPAGADAPDQVGWWNKLNGGLASPLPIGIASPLGPPALDPSAPEGSIQLGVDPSGPTAIGALRWDSVPAGSTATLTLTSTRPLPPAQVFAIALCRATSPWTATQNGQWGSRPSNDSVCATPIVTDTTLTWTLDDTWATDDGLSVVLLPSGAAAYQVTIDKPGADSLAFEAPPETTTTTEQTTTTVAVESTPPVTEPIVTTPVVTTPVVTVPPHKVIPKVPVRTRPIAAVPVPKPFKDLTRGERIAAVALLLAMMGAWWWVGGQPVRNPRLLGVTAGEGPSGSVTTVARMGGVGRFAKLRTARPRRL